MSQFQINARLQQDCFDIGQLTLSKVLMMNDNHYPWFILVPMVVNISEIYQLSQPDQQQLIEESSLLAETLQTIYLADKINIASIGNLVSQLHIHHVVRYHSDIAWPYPVWGRFPCQAYSEEQVRVEIARIRTSLKGYLIQ